MNIPFQQAHTANYRAANRTADDIRYLVIHFTANDGDTAKNNADYFARSAVSTSAHYFVDTQGAWQSVHDHDIAWHCGTRGTYYHPYCRNSNSIGIELCSRIRGGRYEFAPETVQNALALTRQLMAQYDIPVTRVVRHYDVTHKCCPEPFVSNAAAWQRFLQELTKKENKEENDMTEEQVKRLIAQSQTVYRTAADVPNWAKATVDKLTRKGLLKGEGDALNLSGDLVRTLVINDRAGLYD